MSFLRNGWYVAAMSDEIGRDLFARRILGEPLLIYRTESGTPVILEDFCPHRLLPLSKGCLVGDVVQCAYHGLQFDSRGRCVKIPGQKNIPGNVFARSYPVVEKHQWLYVWMGEAERADPALIPDYALPKDDPTWHHFAGRFGVACNYLLVLDNLMDLSHLAYVHGASVGNPDIAELATVETTSWADRVRVCRTTCDVMPASAYADFGNYDHNIHRWQVTEYAPPTLFLVNNGSKPADQPSPTAEDIRGQGRWGFQVYHAITPETETTTHDFGAPPIPTTYCPWKSVRDSKTRFCVFSRKIKRSTTLSSPRSTGNTNTAGSAGWTPRLP